MVPMAHMDRPVMGNKAFMRPSCRFTQRKGRHCLIVYPGRHRRPSFYSSLRVCHGFEGRTSSCASEPTDSCILVCGKWEPVRAFNVEWLVPAALAATEAIPDDILSMLPDATKQPRSQMPAAEALRRPRQQFSARGQTESRTRHKGQGNRQR